MGNEPSTMPQIQDEIEDPANSKDNANMVMVAASTETPSNSSPTVITTTTNNNNNNNNPEIFRAHNVPKNNNTTEAEETMAPVGGPVEDTTSTDVLPKKLNTAPSSSSSPGEGVEPEAMSASSSTHRTSSFDADDEAGPRRNPHRSSGGGGGDTGAKKRGLNKDDDMDDEESPELNQYQYQYHGGSESTLSTATTVDSSGGTINFKTNHPSILLPRRGLVFFAGADGHNNPNYAGSSNRSYNTEDGFSSDATPITSLRSMRHVTAGTNENGNASTAGVGYYNDDDEHQHQQTPVGTLPERLSSVPSLGSRGAMMAMFPPTTPTSSTTGGYQIQQQEQQQRQQQQQHLPPMTPNQSYDSNDGGYGHPHGGEYPPYVEHANVQHLGNVNEDEEEEDEEYDDDSENMVFTGLHKYCSVPFGEDDPAWDVVDRYIQDLRELGSTRVAAENGYATYGGYSTQHLPLPTPPPPQKQASTYSLNLPAGSTAPPSPPTTTLAAWVESEQKGILPLFLVCEREPPEHVVRSLVEASPRTARWTDENRFLALHTACDNGASTAVIRCLVEANPEGVEATTTAGSTPLQLCVYENGGRPPSPELWRLLATPKTVVAGDMFGNTPLQLLLRYADTVTATFVVSPPPATAAVAGSRRKMSMAPTSTTTTRTSNSIFSLSSYSTSPEAVAKCVGLLDATLDVMTEDDEDELDYYYQYHNFFQPNSRSNNQNNNNHNNNNNSNKQPPHEATTRRSSSKQLQFSLEEKERQERLRRRRRRRRNESVRNLLDALHRLPPWLLDRALDHARVARFLQQQVCARYATSLVLLDLYGQMACLVGYGGSLSWRLQHNDTLSSYTLMPLSWLFLMAFGVACAALRELSRIATLGPRKYLLGGKAGIDGLGSGSGSGYGSSFGGGVVGKGQASQSSGGQGILWNWLDLAHLTCAAASTVALHYDTSISLEEFRPVLVVAAGLLWLKLVSFLRSTYMPFFVFVRGVQHVMTVLIPFLITSACFLCAFAFMLYADLNTSSSSSSELNCDSANGNDQHSHHMFCTLGGSVLGTYDLLIRGTDDNAYSDTNILPSAQALSYLWSTLVVLLLLNVLIAVVNHSFENVELEARKAFWIHRLYAVSEMVASQRMWSGWFRSCSDYICCCTLHCGSVFCCKKKQPRRRRKKKNCVERRRRRQQVFEGHLEADGSGMGKIRLEEYEDDFFYDSDDDGDDDNYYDFDDVSRLLWEALLASMAHRLQGVNLTFGPGDENHPALAIARWILRLSAWQRRALSTFVVAPLWILVGIPTCGLLWPPQIRESLLRLPGPRTTTPTEAALTRHRDGISEELDSRLADLQHYLKEEMEKTLASATSTHYGGTSSS